MSSLRPLHSEILQNLEALPIRLDYRRPEGAVRGQVMICHGFKGFKDWGFFPHVAEEFARTGLGVVTFEFSHNGIGDRPGQFDRLDLFAQDRLSIQLDDASRVLRWLLERAKGPVGILGHSRGALSALALGRSFPDQVGAVVTWNGVDQVLRYSARQLERWEREGKMEFTNARTGQRMAIDHAYVVDAQSHEASLDPVAAGRSMAAAQLIVHAEGDRAVPVNAARRLLDGRVENDRLRLEIIPGSGHTFQAVHPFAGSTAALDLAVELSAAWFLRHLQSPGSS